MTGSDSDEGGPTNGGDRGIGRTDWKRESTKIAETQEDNRKETPTGNAPH